MDIKNGIVVLFFVFGLLDISGCVKIETGPETAEQRTETSELRARDFKVNWVNRFGRVSQVQKADLLKTLIDSVSIKYFDYARQVADQWRQGNTGRGTVVPDSEMRDMVSRWNESEVPLLDAYEDVVEYSIRDLDDSAFYNESALKQFRDKIELFYEIRNKVFYPSGTVEEYELKIDYLKSQLKEQSYNLERELTRFR